MDHDLKSKLEQEQDQLPWKELVRHFAFGRLFIVDSKVDLVDAAIAVAKDDATSIKHWMDSGQFSTPSEEQASEWGDNPEILFTINIVSPFVLAQKSI